MTLHFWPKNDKNAQGGSSRKTGCWCAAHFPETLTLFQTKICDFHYPISDLSKNLIPYFRPAALEPSAWCIMFWDKLIIGFFKFSFCSGFSLHLHKKISMCPDLVSSLPWVFVFLCRQLKTEITTGPATGSPVIIIFMLGFNYLFCIHHHHNIIIIKAKNEAK